MTKKSISDLPLKFPLSSAEKGFRKITGKNIPWDITVGTSNTWIESEPLWTMVQSCYRSPFGNNATELLSQKTLRFSGVLMVFK